MLLRVALNAVALGRIGARSVLPAPWLPLYRREYLRVGAGTGGAGGMGVENSAIARWESVAKSGATR